MTTSELDTDPLAVDTKPDSLDQLKHDTPSSRTSCWMFHDWGEWEDTEKGTISVNDTRVGRYIYQERRCVHCNKVQLNKIIIR